MAAGAAPARRDRPRPGLGVRARRRLRLRRPGARLLQRRRPTRSSRRRCCSRLFEAPHYFRRLGKGQLQEGPRGNRQGRAARHRAQEAAGSADRRLGRRARRRAPARRRSASSSTRSCSSPTRTRPSTRPWSRPRERAQRAPLDLLTAAGAIDRPYQFHWRRFLFEQLPQGHRLSRRCRPRRSRRRCRWPPCAGVLDRRLGDHRDRRRAVGAGPGQRHGGASASTSPRRAWRFGPDSPIDKVARERLSTVYMPGYKLTMLPDAVVQAYTLTRGPRLPGGVALRHAGRGHARGEGARDPARARADRRQPAPRPARRGDHRSRAARARRRPTMPSRRRTGIRLPPGAPPEGAARGGARQARDTSTGPTTTSA